MTLEDPPIITENIANDESSMTQEAEVSEELTKSQLRKMRRQQRWEEKKLALKQRRKAKQSEKRQSKLEQRSQDDSKDSAEYKRNPEDLEALKVERKRRKLEPVPDQVRSACRIVLDCSFDDKMTATEIKSLAQQMSRSYSANRNSKVCVEMIATCFAGQLQAFMETGLTSSLWNPRYFATDPDDILEYLEKSQIKDGESLNEAPKYVDKEKIIYLTADSPNELEDVDEDKVYIIGALVDKNRYKNICFERASALGIQDAKLPIKKYIEMQHRHILTVNHVVELLLKQLETHDWPESLRSVIPQRKIKQPDNEDNLEVSSGDEVHETSETPLEE